MSGDTITGIDYSPLGTFGLGAPGAFSSYDYYMPSNMGMNLPIFTGAAGLAYGGMATPYANMMAYPLYLEQMQQQMEASKADHSANMHNKMVQNQVSAADDVVSGMVQKLLIQGDVHQGVYNLYDKVKEGDQNGIKEEYDKLLSYVYSEFSDEFKAKAGKGNARALANQVVDATYANLVAKMSQTDGVLKDDIKKYGDGAAMNGFMRGFHKDHHSMYVDETINHIYGDRIDHRADKDIARTVGHVGGSVSSVVAKSAIGAGAGAATYVGLGGACSVINKMCRGKFLKHSPGWLKGLTLGGAALGALADIGGQIYFGTKQSA